MRLSSSSAIRAALSASESTLRRSKMPSPPNGDTGARGPCTCVVNDLAFVRRPLVRKCRERGAGHAVGFPSRISATPSIYVKLLL